MKAILWTSIAALILIAGRATFAQDVEVNRQNRTVAVQVTETIEVELELAIVKMGYHSFGQTQEAVYEENARIGSKIIEALRAAGVKKENIETDTATLGRVDSPYKEWTPEERKQKRFEAEQIWSIRVAPSEAQKVTDQAVAAGANEMQEVSWIVNDQVDLEAKAISIAMTKARNLAEQMAQKFGAKIGEPLFISNITQTNIVTRSGGGGGGRYATVEVLATPKPNLKLYPQEVRRDATLYVVFALE
jgi:uncharacterized protein